MYAKIGKAKKLMVAHFDNDIHLFFGANEKHQISN
jgi:hypothetical protein